MTEDAVLADIREAMGKGRVRLDVVPVLGLGARSPGNKEGVQVMTQGANGRWNRVGPLLFPVEGETLADLLHALGSMR